MAVTKAGVVYLRRNGQLLKMKGALTVKPGGPNREVKAGQDGHLFSVDTPTPGMIEGTVTWDGQLDLRALQLSENDTIAVEFKNGSRCVLSEGIFVGEPELNTEENEVSVSWAGTVTFDR